MMEIWRNQIHNHELYNNCVGLIPGYVHTATLKFVVPGTLRVAGNGSTCGKDCCEHAEQVASRTLTSAVRVVFRRRLYAASVERQHVIIVKVKQNEI